MKPTVELMGALPSVVVGFLAGLWLSPAVDSDMGHTVGLLLALPLTIVLAAFVSSRLPQRVRNRVAFGREVLFLVPFLAAGIALLVVVAALGALAPTALVFAVAFAPIAFSLACLGAWVAPR